jgi:hypothetical protein
MTVQAMEVRRLSDAPRESRYYLDGVRVSRRKWDEMHLGKRTDTYASRIETRRDGAEIVRHYHHIRSE